MKKKKIIVLSVILVVIVVALVFILIRKENTSEDSSTTYKDVAASKMTIKNTLTSSGEVTSDVIEIELNTYRKYKEIYFSAGSYILVF
jgi:flagellar basal body-associated protein FliL